MKTADLIIALAETTQQPQRMLNWRIGAWACAGCFLAGAIVVLTLGVRVDLSQAMLATALKSGFGLLAALLLTPVVLQLSRPNTRVRTSTFAVFAFASACLLATSVHLISAHSFAPLGLARGIPACLERVPLLALPIAAMLFAVVRSFAPTRLTMAGAAIGAFSGGVAIIPYALFCPIDSVAYVATWYLLSLFLCAAVGALGGPRLLRWT